MRVDRRTAARAQFIGGHLPPTARVRPGHAVTIVDLSVSGALVEAPLRLRPGSRCELQIETAERTVTTGARVTRCFVARLDPVIRYRAGLVFEHALPTAPGRADLLAEYQLPAAHRRTSGRGVAPSHPPHPSTQPNGTMTEPDRTQEAQRWHRP